MATRFAIFDLGSNSIKFLVADVSWSTETENQPDVGSMCMEVVRERSVTTRLAEDLIRTCELQPESIARTLDALKKLRAEAEELGATVFRAVATSAVRDSNNRKSFLKEARAVLGFPVQLLSGEDEAATVFAGVSADLFWKGRDLMVLDVGGGSAEWIQGKGGKIEKELSMPLGCVRLRERFITEYPLSAAVQEKLLTGVQDQVREGIRDFQLKDLLLVGTGGTCTCLAAIHKELKEYDVDKIQHSMLSRDQIWALWKRLNGLTLDELRLVPGLPPKRADLIVPGVSVVLATMQALKADALYVSIRGLRYGVLERAWREHSTSVTLDPFKPA